MKKSLIFPLLASLAFFLVCFYYCCHLHSLYAETKKLQNALSEKNLLVQKIDVLRSRYPNIELAAQAEAATSQRWKQKLPDKIEADNFIKSLCSEAKKQKLNLININTSPTDDRKALLVSLELSGDFLSFLSFLQNLECSPRFNESHVFKVEKAEDTLHFFISTKIFALGQDLSKNTFAKEPAFSI